MNIVMSLFDSNIENNHNYYINNHVRHIETKVEYFSDRVIKFWSISLLSFIVR